MNWTGRIDEDPAGSTLRWLDRAWKVGKGSGTTRRYGLSQQERSDAPNGVRGRVPERGPGRQPWVSAASLFS